MAKVSRSYSRTVRTAAELLGTQVRQARVERKWSAQQLAERAGVSLDTLRKVERGDPSVTLGVAFDLATLVGVPLFFEDRGELTATAALARDRVALLPQRVRNRPLDDDF